MKFKDPVKWTDTEIELQADEGSRQFLAFFTAWFTDAEFLYDETEPGQLGGFRKRSLIEAVRQSLEDVEATSSTFLSMEWCGTALLLAREHWVHGSELVGQLSYLEKRMLDQMEAIKLVELQESARLPG